MRRIIGFWGYPAPALVDKYKKQYPNHQWVDLDIDFGYSKYAILPEAYCKIVKNELYYLRKKDKMR